MPAHPPGHQACAFHRLCDEIHCPFYSRRGVKNGPSGASGRYPPDLVTPVALPRNASTLACTATHTRTREFSYTCFQFGPFTYDNLTGVDLQLPGPSRGFVTPPASDHEDVGWPEWPLVCETLKGYRARMRAALRADALERLRPAQTEGVPLVLRSELVVEDQALYRGSFGELRAARLPAIRQRRRIERYNAAKAAANPATITAPDPADALHPRAAGHALIQALPEGSAAKNKRPPALAGAPSEAIPASPIGDAAFTGDPYRNDPTCMAVLKEMLPETDGDLADAASTAALCELAHAMAQARAGNFPLRALVLNKQAQFVGLLMPLYPEGCVRDLLSG